MEVLVKSIDEAYQELQKSRTRGAKDKKPRKGHTNVGSMTEKEREVYAHFLRTKYKGKIKKRQRVTPTVVGK